MGVVYSSGGGGGGGGFFNMFYERYADGHEEGIQYVGAGRGHMETKLIEVGAGQGSYTKQKDATYGYRCRPAAVCCCVFFCLLVLLFPLYWVCGVRSLFTGEICEAGRDDLGCGADFCCSQCGVNCYDPITAPRVVVRRHYNTVVRTAQLAMLAASLVKLRVGREIVKVQMPQPAPIIHTVHVVKPNAHYECFNGGDYDHEICVAAVACSDLPGMKNDSFSFLLLLLLPCEGCPKQVVDRNIYHHVTKIQKLHVPVPVQEPRGPPIIHNIPQVYHVPSPPKYVHVPVPGPKIDKVVTINRDVPYPVKEPPQVITVKKPYTVKVPGHRHYVDVPVPSPPHIVNKYKYHYGALKKLIKKLEGSWHHHHVVTITGVQHLKHYDCHAGLSNWYHGWSHVKKSWCCDHHQLGCPGMAHGQWHAHTGLACLALGSDGLLSFGGSLFLAVGLVWFGSRL
eukprot:s7686_g5.t1